MFASATELPAALLRIVIILIGVAVVAGIVVVIGRRRKSTTLALDVTLTLSSWWALLSAVGLLFIVGKAIGGEFAEISNAQIPTPWASDLPAGRPARRPALNCGASVRRRRP